MTISCLVRDEDENKLLLKPFVLESDSGFRSCGGVYSSDAANTTDYSLENKCQKFDRLEWVLDDTMSLNEYRNASGLGYKTKSKAWLTGGFKIQIH